MKAGNLRTGFCVGMAGITGLVGVMSGCTEINREVRTYEGTPQTKFERRDESKNQYYLRDYNRTPNLIRVGVNERITNIEHITTYDVVNVTREEYEVTKKPTLVRAIVAPLYYTIGTFFAVTIGSVEFFKNPVSFRETTARVLSKTVKEEKRNYNYKKQEKFDVLPAVDIGVEVSTQNPFLEGGVSSLVKETDSNGNVVFGLVDENTGEITIETLAEDGENETKILQ